MKFIRLSALLALAVLSALLIGCGKKEVPGSTPESAFKNFSRWTSLGQRERMEQFADKEYTRMLINQYESIAFMSELWPKNIVVVSSTVEGDITKLKVEGKAPTGNSVMGEFSLAKAGDTWLIQDGGWESILGGNEEEEQQPQ